MTDRYAVIGNPVAHSKSPLIHARFARDTGQDIAYEAVFSALDDFERVVERFRAAGGRGMNVTLPFKHRAFALCSVHSERAQHARAVNTLVLEPDAIRGDNTDGVGLVRDLAVNLGCALSGKRILLMGAGGASYGVCGPLLDEGPAALVVANRTVSKAVELCEHFRRVYGRAAALLAPAGYDALGGRAFDVVINATSAGLAGDMPALPGSVFAEGALGYEMLYGRTTPFMTLAARAGAECADGLGMLVEQAAESFFVWRGVRPQTRGVIAALRAGRS